MTDNNHENDLLQIGKESKSEKQFISVEETTPSGSAVAEESSLTPNERLEENFAGSIKEEEHEKNTNFEPPEICASEFLIVGENLHSTKETFSKKINLINEIPCKRTLHAIDLIEWYEQIKPLLEELEAEQTAIKNAEMESKHLAGSNIKGGKKSTSKNKTLNLKRNTPVKRKSLPVQKVCKNYLPAPPIPNPLKFEKEKEINQCAMEILNSPELMNPKVAKTILQKVVGTIMAHTGFESTTESVLNLLTDFVEDYINQICRSLKHHAFNTIYAKPTIFPDAVESVFQDFGIKNLTSLGEFYEKKIIQYHNETYTKCLNARQKYEHFRILREKRMASEKPSESFVREPSNVPIKKRKLKTESGENKEH